MVRKQLMVGRIGNTVEMNLDSCFAKFRAEVNDLNASAALDRYTARRLHSESRDVYPVVAMFDAIRLNRGVSRSRREPPECDSHSSVASLKFRETDDLISEFDLVQCHDANLAA